ncbi:MAG: cobalamin-dependent protein, partial [Kiritimatiellaeota bacterium]|nr:cobalamin-dependent protein [Kiritimatiellota bacterium]
MKILLILPHDETYRRGGFFRRSLSYAPLTLTTLAALVPPELEANIELVDEGVQMPVLPQAGYDVVGITCVTASAPRAYALADAFRQRGSRVVLGGSHPTLNPQEGLAHADAVITGPAERAWPTLLRAWASGQACGGILTGRLARPYTPPGPRRDLLPRGRYLPIPTVLAMRGCVNRCSFCSIPQMWDGQAYPRPVAEVIADIQQLPQR